MILDTHCLIDVKITAIHFNFDALQCAMPQNLEIQMQNLADEILHYKLTFLNVSSFHFDIKTGVLSINTDSYEADCLYVSELKKVEMNDHHQYWIIQLIDGIGCIKVFCDDVFLQMQESTNKPLI